MPRGSRDWEKAPACSRFQFDTMYIRPLLNIVNDVPLLAELCKESDTSRLMEETIKAYGRLDILVNNAGILQMGSIENTTMEQYDTVMNTNVRSGDMCVCVI